MHGSLLGSKHLPVVGVNVASIPAGGLSVVAVAAIDGSNANTRRWNANGGIRFCPPGPQLPGHCPPKTKTKALNSPFFKKCKTSSFVSHVRHLHRSKIVYQSDFHPSSSISGRWCPGIDWTCARFASFTILKLSFNILEKPNNVGPLTMPPSSACRLHRPKMSCNVASQPNPSVPPLSFHSLSERGIFWNFIK